MRLLNSTRRTDGSSVGMHIAVVVESVPVSHSGGGANTALAVIRAILNEGHKVTVLSVSQESGEEDSVKTLENLGVEYYDYSAKNAGSTVSETRPLVRGLRRVTLARENLFPGYRAASNIREALNTIEPDAVFAYHWNSLAALEQVSGIPILGAVGDPMSAVISAKELAVSRLDRDDKAPNPARVLYAKILSKRYRRLELSLLGRCTSAAAFAAHHAEAFRQSGVQCKYLRTPIENPSRPVSVRNESAAARVLLLGHLRGTATLAGLQMFAEHCLPILRPMVLAGTLEIHILGGFVESLPIPLRRVLDDAGVVLRGHVSPPDFELSRADVVVVPTPIDLGVRVRILTAFAHGRAVLTHKSNSRGIPELIDGKNCRMVADGRAMGQAVVDLLSSKSVRNKIAKGGHQTFREFFSFESAGNVIVKELESICLR